MRTQCFSLAPIILRQRPFVYFPRFVQDKIAAFFNKNFQACASAFFLEKVCNYPELDSGESSEYKTCWDLDKVEYYPNGVERIIINATAPGVEVVGFVELSDIGVISQANGKMEQVVGTCPDGCENNEVWGVIACEITGSLTFTGSLLKIWNVSVQLNVISALLFPHLGFGDINSRMDFITDVGAANYSYTLRVNGPNKGIIYTLGRFDLAP